jgi:hypothetical protein
MAGSHQICGIRLGSTGLQVVAGTGAENVVNGPRNEAAFAQPSGLATDGHNLYVADSEGSAIRKIPFTKTQPVTTVAGTHDLPNGQSLFEFNDIDGNESTARFQHPLGLTYYDGHLLVADTYNHKIKSIDLATGDVKTELGNGKRGDSLDLPQFAEPGGLSVAGGKLYIADSNNHEIKVADKATRRVTVLKIEGLSPPAPVTDETEKEEKAPAPASSARLETQTVAAGDSLQLQFKFKLPDGYKLNKEAPASCRLRTSSSTDLIAPAELAKHHRAELEKNTALVTIPAAHKSGKAVFDVSLSFTYCRDGVGGICKLGSAHWTVPIEFAADAKQSTVELTATVRE